MKENIKSDFIYWLRWFFVFPGAILIGFLSTFPLHWILVFLYFHFVRGNINSIISDMRNIVGPIESFLYPSVAAFFYIYGGYKIAPKNKFKTVIVLFVLYLIIWLIGTIVALFKININGIIYQFSFRQVFTLLGAILGLYVTKKLNSKAIIEINE
jgi:hypothetical protein